jgi:hypothetical protein
MVVFARLPEKERHGVVKKRRFLGTKFRLLIFDTSDNTHIFEPNDKIEPKQIKHDGASRNGSYW